jgi:hypothetical protein
MTPSEVLKAAIQRRSRATWWAYMPAAAVLIFFAVMGWGEEGASAAAIFILLLLVCVVQWMRPTLLVWGLLVCLFSAYAAAVIATPHNGTFSDYLFFSLCGAVPAVVLLFGRPKGSMSAVACLRQLP